MTRPRAPLVNFSLALLSAALLVLVFPNIVFTSAGFSWLAPVALIPLLIAVAGEPRPLWRFLLGEITGIVYWFGICYWIQFVLEVHGGMGRWGGWGTFALFCMFRAVHLGVFSMFAAVLLPTRFAVPAIAALWAGIERVPSLFGFVWLALGDAGIGMQLPLRLAPFTGVYGLSFLFALASAAIAVTLLGRSRRQLYWLALALLPMMLPDLPAPETGDQTALLVQPNMDEDADYTPQSAAQVRDNLVQQTLAAARGSNAQLILWPEVPGPIYYYQDPAFRDEATNLARLTHAYFLFGTVGQTSTGAPLNSAVMLQPGGDFVDRYDKINLVPFGEYVPPLFGFVNRVTHEAGDFAPGNRMVTFPVDARTLGAFICYESVFPDEVRQFAKQGAQLLVNLSNDGYFGHSAAREQHLEMVRMRAVENRRWLLRATNDGITAVVDPAGRVTLRLPLYRAATARAAFRYEQEKTPYTEHGDWFAWTCLGAAAMALFFSQWPHYTAPDRRPTSGGSQARRRP
jgi:apolipoprotein N-acyltransferase